MLIVHVAVRLQLSHPHARAQFLAVHRIEMDPRDNTKNPRGRPAERADFFPNAGSPSLQRRESSLSQEDENEVFEDARETWDTEVPNTPTDAANIGGGSVIDKKNGRMNNLGAQEEWLLSRNPTQEDTAHTPAQPEWTTRHNLLLRKQADDGKEAVMDLLTSNQSQPWAHRQQPTRPPSMTPSISIIPSEGYPHGAEGRSSSVAPSTAPSVAREDTNTRYDKKCEVCKKHVRDIWYCNVCKYSFCNACWDNLFLHQQPPRKGRGEMPHEKTNPTVAEKVQEVMFPPADDWAREQLYKDDEITSWFGKTFQADTSAPNLLTVFPQALSGLAIGGLPNFKTTVASRS